MSSFSCALTFTDLGSEKHVTNAEVKDAVRVCDGIMEDTKQYISSIAVDNAARAVARKISQHYQFRDDRHIVVARDAAHSVDLGSKDIAKLDSVKRIVEEAREIHSMVRNDRIDSMRLEAVEMGDLHESFAGQTLCETRMNDVHIYLGSAVKQFGFLTSLPRNPNWKAFLQSRKPADRKKWEETLNRNIDNNR